MARYSARRPYDWLGVGPGRVGGTRSHRYDHSCVCRDHDAGRRVIADAARCAEHRRDREAPRERAAQGDRRWRSDRRHRGLQADRRKRRRQSRAGGTGAGATGRLLSAARRRAGAQHLRADRARVSGTDPGGRHRPPAPERVGRRHRSGGRSAALDHHRIRRGHHRKRWPNRGRRGVSIQRHLDSRPRQRAGGPHHSHDGSGLPGVARPFTGSQTNRVCVCRTRNRV